MENHIARTKEYLNIEGIPAREKTFLSGVICGIRATQTRDSCIIYIEETTSHLILWASRSCIEKKSLEYEGVIPPLRIRDLSIYSMRELERIELLDRYAIRFIQDVAVHSIEEYTAVSYIRVQDKGNVIYERSVRFLPLTDPLTPQFVICKLSTSSHRQQVSLKVIQDGKNYYYRLRNAPSNWVRRDFIELSHRESLILHLAAEGLKESEIATQLHVSLPRLKSIKKAMFGRMCVTNICQAIRRAYLYQLLIINSDPSK